MGYNTKGKSEKKIFLEFFISGLKFELCFSCKQAINLSHVILLPIFELLFSLVVCALSISLFYLYSIEVTSVH